ncbi:inosine-uridine preferring nucleoside hydrolase-like [Histomonas meleagridis]|uniref:inosine-uridine preferring nucleoside hydrolase-like n=1 Tax=Histomonas meleagridis TaxID=135588 RepID=UPI00355A74BE|nr:inosine-uridine preferring nucleoside hydrolase-like [Histomonas meleagridis]KAH0806518.1 inosine-uridine preferring nucleoside hydrolase-like [Histomonas meleagridis]
MNNKRKLWIDTDCGVDDSTAILIALDCPDVEVVGISCVGGNVSLDKVINNVIRTISVYGKDDIPVYPGCQKPLIVDAVHIPEIHGNDGLGDIDFSKFNTEIKVKPQSEHAVFALIKTFMENDDISLLTLGPLTNIALAIHIEPKLITKIKSVIIMGGAEDMKGNTSKTAEFNFFCDPESAHIVMNALPPEKVTLVTWTLTCTHAFNDDIVKNYLQQDKTTMERWLKETWKVVVAFCSGSAYLADPIASFVACYGEKAIKSFVNMKIEVPTNGENKGATIAEESNGGFCVVKEINFQYFLEVLRKLMNKN